MLFSFSQTIKLKELEIGKWGKVRKWTLGNDILLCKNLWHSSWLRGRIWYVNLLLFTKCFRCSNTSVPDAVSPLRSASVLFTNLPGFSVQTAFCFKALRNRHGEVLSLLGLQWCLQQWICRVSLGQYWTSDPEQKNARESLTIFDTVCIGDMLVLLSVELRVGDLSRVQAY